MSFVRIVLKSVYQCFTKEEAELELDKLEEKWDKKHPIVYFLKK